ncbi:Ger(x)C family spore germination protein [Oceanobacillus senegalensis]|uniref:Ger(x)C family spore germination protein n=1 Tax=Oceanobacillus senegalensis TaxID=1936063 RepID=UPI000A312824|nr:Ger(x)C family spore germination protein [Oceanobacillus senegalensis]
MLNINLKPKVTCLLCFMMLILTGCWDRVEVNDVAIVTGTGVDKTGDGEMELSVQIIIPKAPSGGQGDKLSIVEQSTGKTITDVNSKLQQKLSRKLFVGHNSVLFIGEKKAEEGIHDVLDVFARHPFERLRTYVFVTKDKPIDLLAVTPDLERTSSEVARELAKGKTGLSVTVKDVLQMLNAKGRSAALPILKIDKGSQGSANLSLSGTAIFNNGKLVGEIDDAMTRGVLWVRNEIETANVTVSPENGEGLITFEILEADSKLIPIIDKGKWKLTVRTTSIDDVLENNSNLNIMNPEILKKLENQMQKDIEERIQSALEYVQKDLKSDIFGFDEAFHRHYPDEWAKVEDNWEEKFSEIEVKVQSSVTIERPGRSTTPQGIPKDEVIGGK